MALTAAGDFVKPDLIVYWAAGNSSPADKLREDATLLGSFSAGALPLPAESASMEGRLILFSLADNKVVDVSRPVRFNDSAK